MDARGTSMTDGGKRATQLNFSLHKHKFCATFKHCVLVTLLMNIKCILGNIFYVHIWHYCQALLFGCLAPLVKIKQAIQKLRQETSQMDIRIGVVDHILLQARLKDKHDQNRSVARAAQEVDDDIM